jgi:hypothetical protein
LQDVILNKGCDTMKKVAIGFLGALVLTALVAMPTAALQWPSPATCTDSLTIYNVQNPGSSCHPGNSDSLFTGIRGIVTAMDVKPSGTGFWLQNSAGGPYSGIDVFTANNNWPVTIGDSVIVCPTQATEFNNETELTALNGSFGGNFAFAVIAHSQALPPFQEGTPTTWNNLSSNTDMEQWEGCLVKCVPNTGQGPLRVARVYGTAYMVVDSACTTGICDSVFVDVVTIPNPQLGVPALGTALQWVRGIVGQTVNGYRIRMRDDNDWYPSVNPPSVAYAYAITDDTVRVVFDKQVTQASAEDEDNYQLGTFGGTVNSATLEPSGTAVMLHITNGLGHKVTESVSVSNLVAVVNSKAMTSTQSVTFWNGLTPIADVQAPDPAGLLASPCTDRSLFAGTGSALGDYRFTMRGVCTAVFPEGLNYLQDNTGNPRSGVAMYAPMAPLVVGHQYLMVTGVQEYFGETEATGNIYLRDEGVGTMPTPIVQTVGVLRDTTCDASQTVTNGEDYEGMLVKLQWAKAVENAANPGNGFDVAGPIPTWGDTIHIRDVKSGTPWTYQADSLAVLDITGVQTFSFGTMQVSPRTDADFFYRGFDLTGVPPTAQGLSFTASPNPARVTKVSFSLPKQADVDLSVFDLSGRKIATLASGSLPAGQYARDWNGSGAGAGVYFVRLRVGSETYNLRTVSLR